MQIKIVAVICVFIISSVMASHAGPAPGVVEKPKEEVPQEQPSGSQKLIVDQDRWQPFGFIMSKLKGMFSKSQSSGAQELIAIQENEPASGIIVTKPKNRVSIEQPNRAQRVQEQPSGPQVPIIAGQEDEQASGVIVVKLKLPKQEQPGSAQGGPGGNILLKNVDEIASLEKGVKEVDKNEELLKAAKEKLRKNVFNRDIGSDKNIFEAIMAAKGKSLSVLFEMASPKVLEALAKQNKRPKVKEWAEGAIKAQERIRQSVGFQGSFRSSHYDAIIELIGGLTTFDTEFTRNKFMTDGMYASVLGREESNDVCFQLLLDSATSAIIRLALNSEWLTHRFGPQDNDLTQKAKSRHSDLEEAYKKYVEPNIAHQLGIASGKDGRHPIRGVSEHIASFLRHQLMVDDIITGPSGGIDPSVLELFRVHLKDGIPKEIIELAVGKGQAKGFKLNEEQVKQVRPYGPALVAYIFEHELDIERLLDRTGLYADYETFVAFMDVYGPNIRMVLNEGKKHKIVRVFHKFNKALGGRYMVRALFSVQNFPAALSLYYELPKEKPFTEARLRFLAKVTRFPLDAFSIVMAIREDGGLFWLRASVIHARRVKDLREAAEKNNLDYLRKHLLDGNVTEDGLRSILEHGSAIPMEAFKLLLSVTHYLSRNIDHMSPEQRALAEGHNALSNQLEWACSANNLESIRTVLANPHCTPGMRVHMFLVFPRHGVLVEGMIPGNCDLLLARWMNWGARRSAELDAVIDPCLQHHAAKHELVKSP